MALSLPIAAPLSAAAREPSGYLWYVTGFLTLASTVSFIDRQILALMIGPVQRDLGVSDTMMGLLGGLAFTLFYTLLTLPMAWLADRGSRRRIIGVGIFFWSLATMLCGLADRFWLLFAARVGVGVGEATLGPAAVSMLSDYFDRARLPLAIGVFSAAPFIGVGLANILGGAVVESLEAMPRVVLPLLGEVRSWQAMFLLVGAPGVLLAFVTLTVREPARRERLDVALPLRDVVAFLAQRRTFLAWHFAAYTALSMQGWALFYWIAEFFIREHGAGRAEIGLAYGLIALIAGTVGSVVAGLLSARMLRGGRVDATLRLVLICSLLLIPVGVAMPLAPGYATALVLATVATFFMGWPSGLGLAALQDIVPNELRGRIIALYLVVVNFLAYTLGPLLGGLIGDEVFGGESLGGALALMAAVNYPLAAFCVWRALRHFRARPRRRAAWRGSAA